MFVWICQVYLQYIYDIQQRIKATKIARLIFEQKSKKLKIFRLLDRSAEQLRVTEEV